MHLEYILAKGDLITERVLFSLHLQIKSAKLTLLSIFSLCIGSAQKSDLATFLGDLSKSEKKI